MATQNARRTVLQRIAEHDGEWGWYQFERAFPPGWFTEEPPTTRAKDVLDQLEEDGLVTTVPGVPQRKYQLTDRGSAVLRETVLGPASAR